MRLIVQKFGGTSVATPEGRNLAVKRVLEAKAEGMSPVVVVSAMGRNGDPYATDTLINMAKQVESDIESREQDLLTSCGEIISTVVMVQTLRAQGHMAVALTGGQAGIITDENFGGAQILEIDPRRLLHYAQEGYIVVVAGFQGMTADGMITTLGRGGSDTTATALGVALKADVVEIYTDVDGVMTVDPRLIPEAQILDNLTYREVCEMAHQGAKVIHPRAVEIAMTEHIPIKIKNTFSSAPGTLIAEGCIERIITGLAYLTNLAQIGVITPDEDSRREAEVKIFKALAERGISIDLINVMPEAIYFTVGQEQAARATDLLSTAGFNCRVNTECAKLSVIGAGMQGVAGVMADIVETLYTAGVTILQTSDSDITISFLVKEDQLNDAVKILHDKFALNNF